MSRPEPLRRVALGCALALTALLATGCRPHSEDEIAVSLLAVGDAGAPPADEVDYARMLAVTGAMAEEDSRRAVDGLVLLGDNFYPSGLHASELVERVAANIVAPLCRFVESGAPRYAEVAERCAASGALRHAVPIYAVLGNHDYEDPAGPALEREALPQFVANWRMPLGVAALHELPGGVSLVLFDSEALLADRDVAPLVRALRVSAGPWRVLAAHRPIATLGAEDDRAENATYVQLVRSAVAQAGVAVQLVVAGHEHHLAILTMAPPDPPLHVVAGGGSERRKSRVREPNTRFELDSLGFARIDLVRDGQAERLRVSLHRVYLYAWLHRLLGHRLAAQWSVDRAGNAREE